MELSDRPWQELPPELGTALRPKVAEISADIIATVRERVVAYRDDTPASDRLRLGVEHALGRFFELVAQVGAEPALTADLYRSLGRASHDEGRGLETLHDVFSIAARVAYRWMGYAAREVQLPSQQMHVLAESIFVYIDELSGFATEGFTAAASEAAGERQQRRGQLLASLLVTPALGQATVEAAARHAGWRLPVTLAVVALAGKPNPAEMAGRIDPDVLAGVHAGLACLIVPDPDTPGRQALIARAVKPVAAAAGPSVIPAHAARSWQWARRTLELAARDLLVSPAPVPRADEHLVELVLSSEADLLEALAERRLGPLLTLSGASRMRLEDTLLAWLEHGRSAPAAATALHTHPQTIRYRLGQLRDLLGPALDTPQETFELELALRGRRLRAPSRSDHSQVSRSS